MRSHTDTSPLSRSPLNTTYREDAMHKLDISNIQRRSDVAQSYKAKLEDATKRNDIKRMAHMSSMHRLVVVQLQEAIWSL